MDFRKDIEAALKTDDKIEALRSFVFRLNQEKGLKKEEVYSIFYEYSLKLYEDNRDFEAELLEDVMDMITGWYVGQNIKLD